MNLTEEKRKELIPELETIKSKFSNVGEELYYLLRSFSASPDNQIVELAVLGKIAGLFSSTLDAALDKLKRDGCQYIRDYVSVWYTSLHYDMSEPLVEISEEDIQPPTFESVKYVRENEYEIIMHTLTHGRERVIVHSNSSTWIEVYSSDKIIAIGKVEDNHV